MTPLTQIIQLPKILDKRGNLTFIESNQHILFDIKRTYWIYDVPSGENRGSHAFREQEEFIVALSGSFDVVVDDGKEKEVYQLNRSNKGLYIPKGNWRYMDNFSTNSLALVLASTVFNVNDYIIDYSEFLVFSATIKKEIINNSILNGNFTPKVIDAQISTINECKVIKLEINHRDKGNITVIENNQDVPFDVKRIYYLYDVPGGESRGGHAHKELLQLIVAVSGSFRVTLDDGNEKRTFTLKRPYEGLLIVPGIWRELDDFSSGSVCLVLASEHYLETDYIRDFIEFKEYKL